MKGIALFVVTESVDCERSKQVFFNMYCTYKQKHSDYMFSAKIDKEIDKENQIISLAKKAYHH